MPELPEVETTRRGIAPHIVGDVVESVVVRNAALRWPVPGDLARQVNGQELLELQRRAKYLLLRFQRGYLMIHLGMSGSLRIVDAKTTVAKHDHIDLLFSNGLILRYHDPRRFGSVLWISGDRPRHKLLDALGPEPLSDDFGVSYLYALAQGRNLPVKSLIMDSHVVVGVGNIYANEALFTSGIRPLRPCNRISRARYTLLTGAIKNILGDAIEQGGTTLRDFVGGDGKPGYFKQQLQVYGRGGKPCLVCAGPLKEIRISQRTSVYCPRCQR